jgi:hypothetical protein
VMGGPSGATSGMNILTRMDMASSRGRHGGKASMETSGTAPGESNTTGPGGCTNMAGAAAVSTGTLTSPRRHGMNGSHISGSTTALRTLCSFAPF